MSKDNIELPPLPPLHIVPSVEPVDYPEVAQALQDYAREAIEADRKRKKPLTSERIKELWGETLAEMGDGGDPVIWFARAIERAHGIPAPQPAEPVKVNAIFETEDDELIGTTDAKVKRVEWQDDGSLTVVIDYWPQPASTGE